MNGSMKKLYDMTTPQEHTTCTLKLMGQTLAVNLSQEEDNIIFYK